VSVELSPFPYYVFTLSSWFMPFLDSSQQR
jgi:hypothetical protein